MSESQVQNVSKIGIASITLRASSCLVVSRLKPLLICNFDSGRRSRPARNLALQGQERRLQLLQRCHLRHDAVSARRLESCAVQIHEPVDQRRIHPIREGHGLCAGYHHATERDTSTLDWKQKCAEDYSLLSW